MIWGEKTDDGNRNWVNNEGDQIWLFPTRFVALWNKVPG